MKILLLSAVASALTFSGWSQANFKNATIVNNNGDTLHGQINYKEWNVNPKAISFKTNNGKHSNTKYAVKDIRYFEIENMEYYERFPVSVSMDKIAPIAELSMFADNTVVRDTVMLKIIQKGKFVDLFSYRDRVKTRYYIKEHDADAPVELIYKRYLQGDNSTVKIAETYKNQLLEVSRKVKGVDANGLLAYMVGSSYTERDLIHLTKMINKGNAQLLPLHKPAAAHFYAGLALSASRSTYDGFHFLTDADENKTSLFPKVTMGVDLLNNPFVGRLLFKAELSLTGANYTISRTWQEQMQTHSFKQYTGAFSFLAQYNIYNTKPLKLNAGVGFSINLSKYSDNESRIDDLGYPKLSRIEDKEMKTLWLGLPFRVGSVFQQKFELYAQYNYALSSITNYSYYAIHTNSLQVGFNYVF
ncbi:MAG: hypothetical protein EOO04_29400 [Chitinophagaceae bacterium]|nr:MAG: hypothetical protein EOO04_29400 [Chitinophagaceae bacterium]